jgi:hypothetical protein
MWKRRLWSVLYPLLLTILCCGLQTVVWPNIFGSLTSPPLWLLIIVWLSVYRQGLGTVLLIYGVGWIASAFTAMPLKMMFTSLLLLHLLISMAKERVFWYGTSYFVLASVSAVTLFHFIYLSLSFVIEPVHAAWLPFERITQILLSVPFALLMYNIMSFLDRPVVEASAREGGAT